MRFCRGGDGWIVDNGAAKHMTPHNYMLYNLGPPSPENATVYIGDGIPLAVEYVESLDLVFIATKAYA